MSRVQIILTPGGERLAIVPADEYEALVARAAMPEKDDRDDLRRIDAVAEEVAKGQSNPMPVEAFKRILDGESPVRVWRQLRGLTGTELARRAGVVPSAVSNIETGGRRAGSVRTLRKLAKVLEVDVDELLPIEDERERSPGA